MSDNMIRRKEVNVALFHSNPQHLGHEQGLDVPYNIPEKGKQESIYIENYHDSRGICISINGVRGHSKAEIYLEKKYYRKLIETLYSRLTLVES